MTETCSSSPGATHWLGCACHEARWAAKREAKKLRGELMHHPCGALVRIVIPSPAQNGGRDV